jgi:tRNA(Ile)-lysidine synthase
VLREIAHYVRTHQLLKPGERVGIAVSGGADSVALLRAMLELRGELGIVLSAVHFHHGIRGEEADEDEAFVTRLTERLQLPFFRDQADVPKFARANGLSLEAAARRLRYEFFSRLMREDALDKICTAHTSDDQAETVLLRFLRGSGTRGLAGIHPVLTLKKGGVVRPMLEVSRGDVLAYLKSQRQDWREDSSNVDTVHTRNRIRHELLPLLERDYNPSLRRLLSEVAEASRDEEEFWSRLIGSMAADSIEQYEGATSVRLGLPAMESPAVRRRLLRLGAERAGLRLDFHHVEQLLNLATEKKSGEVELPNGWRARRVGRRTDATIVFQKDSAMENSPGYEFHLSIPSEVQISAISTQVRVTFVPYAEVRGRYNPASLLDASLLDATLVLRNWRPGDRLHPLHRGSEEKLKRLFHEKHVPAEQRGLWPVLTSGDKVVWAKDFAVAAEFAAGEGTSQAVLVEAVEQ